jgi:hypothetical protein
VEVGQKVAAGTPLGDSAALQAQGRAQDRRTTVKDVTIGQHAVIDTRNGLTKGAFQDRSSI